MCQIQFYYKWIQCVRFSFTRNGFSVLGLILLEMDSVCVIGLVLLEIDSVCVRFSFSRNGFSVCQV